jgi:hypothetical protein
MMQSKLRKRGKIKLETLNSDLLPVLSPDRRPKTQPRLNNNGTSSKSMTKINLSTTPQTKMMTIPAKNPRTTTNLKSRSDLKLESHSIKTSPLSQERQNHKFISKKRKLPKLILKILEERTLEKEREREIEKQKGKGNEKTGKVEPSGEKETERKTLTERSSSKLFSLNCLQTEREKESISSFRRQQCKSQESHSRRKLLNTAESINNNTHNHNRSRKTLAALSTPYITAGELYIHKLIHKHNHNHTHNQHTTQNTHNTKSTQHSKPPNPHLHINHTIKSYLPSSSSSQTQHNSKPAFKKRDQIRRNNFIPAKSVDNLERIRKKCDVLTEEDINLEKLMEESHRLQASKINSLTLIDENTELEHSKYHNFNFKSKTPNSNSYANIVQKRRGNQLSEMKMSEIEDLNTLANANQINLGQDNYATIECGGGGGGLKMEQMRRLNLVSDDYWKYKGEGYNKLKGTVVEEGLNRFVRKKVRGREIDELERDINRNIMKKRIPVKRNKERILEIGNSDDLEQIQMRNKKPRKEETVKKRKQRRNMLFQEVLQMLSDKNEKTLDKSAERGGYSENHISTAEVQQFGKIGTELSNEDNLYDQIIIHNSLRVIHSLFLKIKLNVSIILNVSNYFV